MRSLAPWAGRDVLDVGCGTGFHLPAVRRHRPLGHRRRAARRPGRDRATPAYAPARRTSRVLQASADVAAAAGGVGRRGARALGLLLRPRLRARPRRARPGDAPRRPRLRHRQRPDPLDVRRAGSAAATPTSTRRGRAVLGRTRAGSGTRSTSPGPSTRARTSRPSYASSSPPTSPRRSWPATRAPRSTTRSTCGAGPSEQLPGQPGERWLERRTTSCGLQHPALVAERLVRQHEVQDPDQLDGDLLERLAHRGQARPGHLGGERVVEADDADVGPGPQAALGARVQHPDAEGVAGAGEAGDRGVLRAARGPPSGRRRRCR